MPNYYDMIYQNTGKSGTINAIIMNSYIGYTSKSFNNAPDYSVLHNSFSGKLRPAVVVNWSGVNLAPTILPNELVSGYNGLWKAEGAKTIVSGGISQWNSEVSGNHLTPSATGRRPTLVSSGLNGYDVALFDGVNDTLMAPYGVCCTNPQSITIVCKAESDAANGATFVSWHDNTCLRRDSATNQFSVYQHTVGAAGEAANNVIGGPGSGDTWSVITLRMQRPTGDFIGTRHQARVNGINSGYFASAYVTFPGGIRIYFGSRADYVDFGKVNIAEAVVYPKILTDSEARQNEQFYANKFGLTLAS